MTHTKSNVIQYNEYYPFGLQAGTSWTRESSSNNFLYNGGSEMNASSGWYETFFRGYDPTLGRFLQIDPMATSEMATYQYAGNNPVYFNDPTGATANAGERHAYTRALIEQQWKSFMDRLMDFASTTLTGGVPSELLGEPVGGGTGGGGAYGVSAASFIDQALLTDYGGSWSNGQGYLFESQEETWEAAIDYNNYHDSWSTDMMWNMVRYNGNAAYKADVRKRMTETLACSNCDMVDVLLQTQGAVVLDVNGNVMSWGSGANDIYVNINGKNVRFHDVLVKSGKMNVDAFGSGLLNIVRGMKSKRFVFDESRLYNGKFSVAFTSVDGKNVFSSNGGIPGGISTGMRLAPDGSWLITYYHINGILTVDALRSQLGVHEYYGHAVERLDDSPGSEALIKGWVNEYLSDPNR